MHSILRSIAVCFTLISNTQSQRLFPLNSRNPTNSVKDFAESIKQQWLQEQCIVEKYGSSRRLFSDLMGRTAVNGNASDCDISLRILLTDLLQKKKYAIRMIDSWGKIESGVVTGNIQWFGRYYECINSHASRFSGKYFYLMFGSDTRAGFGVCLPSTCTTAEAEQISYPLADQLKINVKAYHPVQPSEFTAADILGIVILSVLGCLVFAATVYELYLNRKRKEMEEHTCIIDESETKQKSFVFGTVLLSFSFIKNTKAIFDTTQKEESIGILHGLRFFSMTWVVIGHTFQLGTIFVDNGVDAAYYYVTRLSFQAVGNASFSVDSFFFLSGLLAAYLGLKDMKKRKGKINVLLMYSYRYLRLTPAYALCILIVTGLYSKLGDGPFWPLVAQALRKPCQTYWWTNLLYINNLYPASLGDECFAWGWYLANDMQFFLFLPLLLVLMFRHPLVGTLVLNLLVIISMVISGVLSSHYEQQPLALITALYLYPAVQVTMFENDDYMKEMYASYSTNTTTPATPPTSPSQSDIFWSDTYAKPWCRMGVYFIGVMAGLILYSTNARVRMNKISAFIGWVVVSVTALALIYGLFGNIEIGQPLPVNLAAFYNAVSRPIWAFCLMWIVIASTAGYGGRIDAILSWKAFIPLSRLTYCAYLIHPAVIYYVYGVMEEHLHFGITLISVLCAGIIFLSYALAYVISILIEMPMLGLTKLMFGKTKMKSSSISAQYTNQQIKL